MAKNTSSVKDRKTDTAAKTDAKKSGNDGVLMISEAMLKKLLKDGRVAQAEVDGLVGNIREQIGNAVEKHHLHKGAFALIKKFDKMEAEPLAALWDTMLAYMDMTGLMKRIESVEKLPFGEAPAVDDELELNKVSRLQFGGKKNDERAFKEAAE
jgi:hypothetical protein